MFAKELRKGKVEPRESRPPGEICLLLDNVYDTFNVGGMYRVADAAGVGRIYHCGDTPVPPDPKIARASVGLYQYIAHEHRPDILELVDSLSEQGYKIVVLEQDPKSRPFDQVAYAKHLGNGHRGIALIVGNETFGVQKEVSDKADLIVELPMYGVNKSLNVVVATGIVLYQIRRSLASV